MVSALTRRQHGVAARRQLVAGGLSNGTIGRMLRSGWLTRVHDGVYALSGQPLSLKGRWMAAALAGGRGALVSHRSAAELGGIIDPIDGPVHVTVGSGRRRIEGVVFHRAGDLHYHRAVRDRIPVTTIERTLLDLAGSVGLAALRRAFEEADRLELLDRDTLARLCERTSGPRGTGRLRTLLRENRPLTETRSEFERRLIRLCRDGGVPSPATNDPVEGFLVDCLWPRARLMVELDGYTFHRSRASFERDRARDAALNVAGYRVVRDTYRMLAEQPRTVLSTIRDLLNTHQDGI